MSKGKRREQARRRAQAARSPVSSETMRRLRTCIECGEQGPHFVPPSFGDPGLWMCTGRWATDRRPA